MVCLPGQGAQEAKSDKTIVHAVSTKEMLLLRNVDKKYQKEHGIHLAFDKVITLSMLGSTKKSSGEIWLNEGQMKLLVQAPQPSKIVATKDYLWIENPPPPGFEDSKIQVLRASLKSKQAKSQGLIQLLTKGGVLKYFRVSGIQREPESITFYLQPDNQSVEFKRAQLVVDLKSQEITQLSHWDQMDNETHYHFTKSQFKQKLDPKLFDYKPPQNSNLIIY